MDDSYGDAEEALCIDRLNFSSSTALTSPQTPQGTRPATPDHHDTACFTEERRWEPRSCPNSPSARYRLHAPSSPEVPSRLTQRRRSAGFAEPPPEFESLVGEFHVGSPQHTPSKPRHTGKPCKRHFRTGSYDSTSSRNNGEHLNTNPFSPGGVTLGSAPPSPKNTHYGSPALSPVHHRAPSPRDDVCPLNEPSAKCLLMEDDDDDLIYLSPDGPIFRRRETIPVIPHNMLHPEEAEEEDGMDDGLLDAHPHCHPPVGGRFEREFVLEGSMEDNVLFEDDICKVTRVKKCIDGMFTAVKVFKQPFHEHSHQLSSQVHAYVACHSDVELGSSMLSYRDSWIENDRLHVQTDIPMYGTARTFCPEPTLYHFGAVMARLVKALNVMHSRGLAHRNVNLDALVVCTAPHRYYEHGFVFKLDFHGTVRKMDTLPTEEQEALRQQDFWMAGLTCIEVLEAGISDDHRVDDLRPALHDLPLRLTGDFILASQAGVRHRLEAATAGFPRGTAGLDVFVEAAHDLLGLTSGKPHAPDISRLSLTVSSLQPPESPDLTCVTIGECPDGCDTCNEYAAALIREIERIREQLPDNQRHAAKRLRGEIRGEAKR